MHSARTPIHLTFFTASSVLASPVMAQTLKSEVFAESMNT